MPRAPRFTISVIADLFAQLEYAPADTRRRQMDAAERLIADINPQQNYPDDFVTYRITGYRPEGDAEPSMLVGQALRADLVNLVLRLSRGLRLPSDRDGRIAAPVEDVARALNISVKTMQRYRRQGLVCHVVVFADGVQRVSCYDDALARFTAGHERDMSRAVRFTRLSAVLERRIVEQARELRRQHKRSLNAIARDLAIEHGRAHETIRQLLRKHDRSSRKPVFVEPGPVDERIGRLMYRAWRMGIEPAALARRYRKSKPTVLRAINRRRADLLRRLTIKHVQLPTFELPDAGKVILSALPVRSGLDDGWLARDVLELIDELYTDAPPIQEHEQALAAAYNFLKHRASRSIKALGAWPASDPLDAIETDLRWAAALRARLTQMGLPAALRRIEHNLHRPITHLPMDEIARLMRVALILVLRTVDALDLARGQRLERMAGFAMDRELARLPAIGPTHKAAVRHTPGSGITIEPPTGLVAWHWLIPPRSWQQHVQALCDLERQAVTLRYGWTGEPPLTCRAVAKRLHQTAIRTVRVLRAAEAGLRRAAGEPNVGSSRCATE
jgi:RNA polymerase primary sigma factor